MPHINMVYPFYKDDGNIFAENAEFLKCNLQRLKPFKVRFSKQSFNYFIHKKYCTLWLRPLLLNANSDKIGDSNFHGQDSATRVPAEVSGENLQVLSNNSRSVDNTEVKEMLEDCGLPEFPKSVEVSEISKTECGVMKDQVRVSDFDSKNSKSDFGHSELLHSCKISEEDMVGAIKSQVEVNELTESYSDHKNLTTATTGSMEDILPGVQAGSSSEFGESHILTAAESARVEKRQKSKITKQEKKAQKKKQQKEGSLLSEDAIIFPPHPEVMKMHSILQDLYPDLATEDDPELGFQPHLSLGQFKHQEVEEFKDKFSSQWTDIEFTVSEVYLISRKDFYDPFHVRETVPLGT